MESTLDIYSKKSFGDTNGTYNAYQDRRSPLKNSHLENSPSRKSDLTTEMLASAVDMKPDNYTKNIESMKVNESLVSQEPQKFNEVP